MKSAARVVIVEDVATARLLLRGLVEGDRELEIVGEATNGAEGVEAVARLRPDVVMMDLHMPVMDGLEATRLIMERCPTPVVIITATADPGELARSEAVRALGAQAVLGKPRGPGHHEFKNLSDEMLRVVKLLAGMKCVTRRGRAATAAPPAPRRLVEVIAIAASTGGPGAVGTILQGLSDEATSPILVVQHIGEGFDASFVEWLDRLGARSVRLARHGEPVVPGEVLVAPYGSHLRVDADHRAVIDNAPALDGYRPSATYLFSSIASVYGPGAVGVVLSGMGRDGVVGLAAMKAAGARVIAQDEFTSAVFGMAGSAVGHGIVDQVLPIGEIADALGTLIGDRVARV